MNTAVCISGLLRTLDLCFPSIIKYILAPTNADVFIYAKECTVEQVQAITKEWPKVEITIGQDVDHSQIYSHEILYARSSTKVNKDRRTKNTVRNLLLQTESIKSCNAMRNQREADQGYKYDLVVRARTDLQFFSSIHEPSYYNPTFLYRPNWGILYGLNDKFAIGGPDVMDRYAQWNDKLVDIVKELGFGKWRHAEQTLLAHISHCGIKIVDSDVKFGIQRSASRLKLAGCVLTN